MKNNTILIIHGEPNSVFLEILIKSLRYKITKSPIILISSKKIVEKQMKQLKFKTQIKLLNPDNLSSSKLDNNFINLINIDYDQKKSFQKISNKSNRFIKESFQVAFDLIKKEKIKKLINGPISKKHFLKKKYLGITEFISDYFSKKNTCMLIYNKKLSVCPVTTHLPLKLVSTKINKKNIINKIKLIHDFYKKFINKKPSIAVLGLNPHCESISKFDEDLKIIKPVVKKMKNNGYDVNGPISADTAFLKSIRNRYDVIIGMYHDQVLTPAKTLFEFDAINITLGLPFLRISPDHGPNEKMMGKNLSNPFSLIQAIKFLDKH